MSGLCPAGWLNEQSITKHWFQFVRTCPYSWATCRNTTCAAYSINSLLLTSCKIECVEVESTRYPSLRNFTWQREVTTMHLGHHCDIWQILKYKRTCCFFIRKYTKIQVSWCFHWLYSARGPQIVGRGPNLGRQTYHPVSWNNSNLRFKFSILIRQYKWNHLLFHGLSLMQFCARKLLLSIEYFYNKGNYFSENYMLT